MNPGRLGAVVAPLIVMTALTGCGSKKVIAGPTTLDIAAADLTACEPAPKTTVPTCSVLVVVANDGPKNQQLDFSRLSLHDAEGGTYAPVTPTGVTMLPPGSNLNVTVAFVIVGGRTPSQLWLLDADGSAHSKATFVAAEPSPAPSSATAPRSSVPPSPAAPRPTRAPSSAVPRANPPVNPPPARRPPTHAPSPVSGGFGNG
ncbi:MAG TPA: hypothetical protein VHE83_10935 [Mycobacteriales bacterium]|nr:hypothetical protein [Mycobacteriales bacterium]